MPLTTQHGVLIAGGGSSGLVLALTLVKHGIPVRIIEKEANHRVGQRGTGIMPRSLELHEFLDTLPDIEERATLIPHFAFYGEDGKTVVKSTEMSPYVEPTPAIPHPNPLMLGQDAQEAILRAHLKQHGCEVELSTELLSFTQADDGVIATIAKRTGQSQVEETVKYSYLVGADGAHSRVRKMLGINFRGETKTAESIVTGDIFVESGEEVLNRNDWHAWGEPSSKMMSLRPAGKGGKLFTLLAMGLDYDQGDISHAYMSSSREAFIDEFYKVTGRRDIVFGDTVWLSTWRPNIRMVDQFSVGRVFLVGDAAHCHSPTGGQGMNSSIQDSWNLAWKLALVTKGQAKPSLLDSYTQERLPVIAEMLRKTTQILNTSFRGTSSQKSNAWRRDGELHQLGINYRGSPIVMDDRIDEDVAKEAYHSGSGIHAGDRAPDASGLVCLHNASRTRLFKLFSPTHHTLLLFSNGMDNDVTAALKPKKDLFETVLVLRDSLTQVANPDSFDSIIHDIDGHASHAYGIQRGWATIVVIRPDAYIGAILHDTTGLQKYLETVFC
ncbi:hypothetical protein BDN72DRAFT_875643 [Pluteus cervinus]|uniref:Uncharacterized protein n=1 Tax=Pluteus cervinus TaxID=181527 RepID=A0ACD3B7S2_9AGAR|nr:hypothetical protein BDN72DRAFT_875643 [Pluteus cervinus]